MSRKGKSIERKRVRPMATEPQQQKIRGALHTSVSSFMKARDRKSESQKGFRGTAKISRSKLTYRIIHGLYKVYGRV